MEKSAVKKGNAHTRDAQGISTNSIRQNPTQATDFDSNVPGRDRCLMLLIFSPLRRSIVSSIPIMIGPQGAKMVTNIISKMRLASLLDHTARFKTRLILRESAPHELIPSLQVWKWWCVSLWQESLQKPRLGLGSKHVWRKAKAFGSMMLAISTGRLRLTRSDALKGGVASLTATARSLLVFGARSRPVKFREMDKVELRDG